MTDASKPDITQSLLPVTRRELLTSGTLGMTALTLGVTEGAGLLTTESHAADALSPPEHNPASEYVFSIVATIDAAMTVGETATGTVRAIPITGGTVEGEGISGRVVPGGADWQLSRSDGVTEIEATYAIELDGDTLVKVVNRGIIAPPDVQGEPAYFRTNIRFAAPVGKYEWLNQAIFLCSAGLHPTQQGAVLVEVFRLV